MSRDRTWPRLRLIPSSVGEQEGLATWLRGTYTMVWYLVGVMAALLFTMIEFGRQEPWPWTLLIFEGAILSVAALWFKILWCSGNDQDGPDL